MRLKYATNVFAAVTLSLVVGCAGYGGTAGNDYRLYLLAGQSNMDGYGFVEELAVDERAGVPGVMIFTGRTVADDKSGGGVGIWVPLAPGHGTGFQTDGTHNTLSDRFGPELAFARRLREREPDVQVAIVKYSMGGTGLAPGIGFSSWDPDYATGTGVNQYDNALSTIRNALKTSDIDGDGTVDRPLPAGIVWMQGEADAYDSQWAADAYLANLKRMMNLLRAALRVDDLPVVIGRITDSGMADDGSVMDYIQTVQLAQKDFVEADECAMLVTATNQLEYLDDGWHYDTRGYLTLGAAFADAMIALVSQCRDKSAVPVD